MQKKILFSVFFVAAIVAISIVFFAVRGHSAEAYPPIDHSIKTQYGVPILVRRVIDGDTIELINGDRVRYVGMDTPEEVDPDKPVQCFAAEGAERNKELVEGKMVTLREDVSHYDLHGRWLAFIYLADGTFVNLELVKEGFAFSYPYPPDITKADEFAAAEAEAEKEGIGLWAKCSVYHTSTGRSQTNTLN